MALAGVGSAKNAPTRIGGMTPEIFLKMKHSHEYLTHTKQT